MGDDKIIRLDGTELIEMMREAWDKKVRGLVRELDTNYKDASGKKKATVSPGLKVKHAESGRVYTVDSLGMKDVVLITPEGDRFPITLKQLNSEYEVE